MSEQPVVEATKLAAADEMRARRTLIALAIILTVVLLGLIIAILLMIPRTEPPSYAAVAGIRPLKVLYGPGVGNEPFFSNPMGAAFAPDGSVYVADTGNNRIVVFDDEGEYVRQWGGLGVGKPGEGGTATWKPGLFNYPTDVAVGDDGNVYVADFRNDQIQVFDSNGRFLRAFPDRNERTGKGASGQGGTGIAVTSLSVWRDRVFATDRYQVVEFGPDGEVMAQFGRPGYGSGEFDHPNGITVNSNSMVVVSDFNNNRVVALGPSGDAIWALGVPLQFELSGENPEIEGPRGLDSSDDGNIIVADAIAQQLVEISSSGELLNVYGRRGSAPGEFDFPTDVDAFDGLLVVAEKGNNRVQIVELEAR